MSSHGLVLVYIATHPEETIKAISEALGLTQRRVVAVVKELAESGLIRVERRGRRNSYRLEEDARFIHPTMTHIKVADFIRIMEGTKTPPAV